MEILFAAIAVGAACAGWGLILYLQRRARRDCARCERPTSCAPPPPRTPPHR